MSPTLPPDSNSEAAGSSRSFWKLWSKTKETGTSLKSVTSSGRGRLTMYLFSPFPISVCFPPHCYCPEITLPNKTITYISVSGWRRRWQPTPVFWPGESYGRGGGRLQSTGSQRVRHDWVAGQHESRGLRQRVGRLTETADHPWLRRFRGSVRLLNKKV